MWKSNNVSSRKFSIVDSVFLSTLVIKKEQLNRIRFASPSRFPLFHFPPSFFPRVSSCNKNVYLHRQQALYMFYILFFDIGDPVICVFSLICHISNTSSLADIQTVHCLWVPCVCHNTLNF